MAIQNELPNGRTGWHGDQSVSLRSTLNGVITLINDVRAQHEALLAKLDADAGVPETDYAAVCGSTVSAVSASITDQLAQGGSYTHGDNAVTLRLILQSAQGLVNDLQAQHVVLVNKLDADALGFSTYGAQPLFAAVLNADPAGNVNDTFANGGTAAHGDQGVALRLAMLACVSLSNAIKASHNDVLASLDGDAVVADADYAASVAVSAPDAV